MSINLNANYANKRISHMNSKKIRVISLFVTFALKSVNDVS